MIKLPIEIGDILLVGRFKNKRIKVKEIGTDDHGLPTVNGRGILKIRIEKLMKTKKTVKGGIMTEELKTNVGQANKNDKFLLYRHKSNSPSPGHDEYLFTSGNTLDELFDNWIEVMKRGGYGYSGSELERQKSLFQKDKLKYWSKPASFYTLKVKRKSDLDQLKMDRDHRKSMASKDFDDDPRESKQFKLADIAKKILKENNDPAVGDRVEVTFIGSNPKYKQIKNKPFIAFLTRIESPRSMEPYTVYYFKNYGRIVCSNDWNFKVIG